MKRIIWKENDYIMSGTTLKDVNLPDQNNMAFYVSNDKEAVLQNRKALCEVNDIALDHCVFPNQTHSDHIALVTKDMVGQGATSDSDAIKDCDALYTKEKNVLLGVFHADCVPVLLYDKFNGIVCVVHAGWQGTTKEIVAKTLNVLIEKEGCKPEQLKAYIGPSIAAKNFEVGKDVIDLVEKMSFDTSSFINYTMDEKAYVDTKGLNKQMLLNAGLLPDNITIDKNDTFANSENLFSYRRGKECGRHLTYIALK